VLTVHQTVGDVRGNYYQEKTVFLRCTVNSNPPARFIWKRGNKPIEQSKDNGVDIYEPLYTQVQHYHDFCCLERGGSMGVLKGSLSSKFKLSFSKLLVTVLSPNLSKSQTSLTHSWTICKISLWPYFP